MNLREKGFTLIELLVVIAIIGMLSAALILTFSKAGGIARDMTCKANLKNLGQAALAFSVQNEHFPDSYPYEWDDIGMFHGSVARVYYDRKGWVNWTGAGRWTSRHPQKDLMTMPKITGKLAYEAMTNGTLWAYTSKDPSTYLCSTYKKAAAAEGLKDVWRSYVMNHRFHWHRRGDNTGPNMHWLSRFTVSGKSTDRSAEMVLLFAELPADNIDTSVKAADGKLDPHNDKEHIGFNHKIGKRNVAHVVFADGHVEVLLEPVGASKEDMLTLTKNLCDGAAINKDVLQRMR
ncbi:MAG: type II secretion system protein [Kiritimatiellae bacterium]|nr:type II secretion system protein [Kiritimatiellia bacterium]